MTENKRFTLKESDIYNRNDVIHDNGIEMPQSTVCDLLNSLNEENVKLKQLLLQFYTEDEKECPLFDELDVLSNEMDMGFRVKLD